MKMSIDTLAHNANRNKNYTHGTDTRAYVQPSIFVCNRSTLHCMQNWNQQQQQATTVRRKNKIKII